MAFENYEPIMHVVLLFTIIYTLCLVATTAGFEREPLELIIGTDQEGNVVPAMGPGILVSALTLATLLVAGVSVTGYNSGFFLLAVAFILLGNFQDRNTLNMDEFTSRMAMAVILVFMTYIYYGSEVRQTTPLDEGIRTLVIYTHLVPMIYMITALLAEYIKVRIERISVYYTTVLSLEIGIGAALFAYYWKSLTPMLVVWLLVVIGLYRLLFLYRGMNIVHGATMPAITKLQLLYPTYVFWFGWFMLLFTGVFCSN